MRMCACVAAQGCVFISFFTSDFAVLVDIPAWYDELYEVCCDPGQRAPTHLTAVRFDHRTHTAHAETLTHEA